MLTTVDSAELAEWQAFYLLPEIGDRLRLEMQTEEEGASRLKSMFKGMQNANTG